MPFIRATRMVSPVDGVTAGFWLQLSTDPNGTWTGLAQSAWPAISGDTLATYAAKVNAAYLTLCTKNFGGVTKIVARVTFTFTSLSPLTIDPNNPPLVTEGDLKFN